MKPSITKPIEIKKYGGLQVAIVDGHVVASGHTSVEALAKARRQFPSRPLTDIAVLAVPKTLHVIYPAWRRRSALLGASTAEANRIQALLNDL